MMARTRGIRWRSGRAVQRVEFQLDGPVDVMIDGEVLTLECRAIDVLPSALRVVV